MSAATTTLFQTLSLQSTEECRKGANDEVEKRHASPNNHDFVVTNKIFQGV